MVKSAQDGLSVFVKENCFNRNPRFWASPFENYLIEQVYLIADGILSRMRSNALTFLDIREDMANLMSLFKKAATTNYEASQVNTSATAAFH